MRTSLTSDLGEAFVRSDLHLLLGSVCVWRLWVAYIHHATTVHTEAWLTENISPINSCFHLLNIHLFYR